MAWVTLHNLLGNNVNSNLKGLVPMDALVIPKKPKNGCGDDKQPFRIALNARAKKSNRWGKYGDSITLDEWALDIAENLKLQWNKWLTLERFCDLFPKYANEIEWDINAQGMLVHFSDGLLYCDNGFAFLNLLRLDLSPWFKEQSDKTLTKFCILGFSYRVDCIAPFFKHLKREIPKALHARVRAATKMKEQTLKEQREKRILKKG